MLASGGLPRHHGGAMNMSGADRSRWRGCVHDAARHCVNLIFPPMCPVCKEPVGADGGVCTGCWVTLSFIEKPLCDRLGAPFAYDPGSGIVSSAALAKPPAWARARGAVSFNAPARELVHALKYRDQHSIAKLMARLMVRSAADVLSQADCLVPVPLYRMRLWQRRFNQAALLARHMQTLGAVPCRPHLLARTRPTQAQVGLDLANRRKNVRGAFRVPDEALFDVAGKACVLVDDVMTTGATAEACTRALLKAGAARVDVIVFALVLNPDGRHI